MKSSPALAASLAAVGLAGLVAGGAWWSTSAAESAMQARSRSALSEAGLDSVQVVADGRDLLVTTGSASEPTVRDVLARVPGAREVRFVEVDSVAAPRAESPAAEAAPTPSSPSSPSSPPSAASSSAPTTAAPTARPPVTPAPQTTIRFARGSADLDAAARQDVQAIIAHLSRYESVSVVLIGRASGEGSNDAALALSWQRAERVAEAITAAGIDPSRVSTAGAGGMLVDSPAMAQLLRRVDVAYEER